MGLHACSVAECVRIINEEDRRVAEAVHEASGLIAAFIEAALPGFREGGRLIYFGAGTSGRLGVLDASECPPTFCVPPERVVGFIAGGDGALRRSSEGKEDDPRGAMSELEALRLTERDAVLGIAAGGTTPYVLGGLEWVCTGAVGAVGGVGGSGVAQDRGGRDGGGRSGCPVVGFLTCSPVPRAAWLEHLIVLETGAEVVTGSTRMKAGSATKMALNIISTTLMIQCGKVYENLMVDVRASNEKLRDRAARIVSAITRVPRDEAFELLDRAGGYVKTAVVMKVRGVNRFEAEFLLAAEKGRLDRVIG